MSEPNEDGRNPFADIIDLFRETAAKHPTGRDQPAASPPRRGRRAAIVLSVALLAVAGGATATVVGHRHDSPTHAATQHPTPTPSLAPAPSTAPPSVTASTAPSTNAADAAYTSALDGFAAATDAASLRSAAPAVTASVRDLRAAGDPLHRAEARHLQALAALATLPLGTQALVGFPGAATAATASAAKVTALAGANPAVADPSLATTNAMSLEGAQVAGVLHQRVTALAGRAAKATLTADLRRVAAQATSLAAPAGSTAGLLSGQPAAQADADAAALRALAGLAVIDGNHLRAWRSIAGPLQTALAKAGVADAGQDVGAITAMVKRARQTLRAWAASNPGAVPTATASASTGPAGPTKKAIRSYAVSARALVERYTQIMAGLPQVAPGQQPSFALTTRFHRLLTAVSSLSGSVARLKPPPGMGGAQRTLARLVAGGRAAALAGHGVALSAEDCDPSTRSCVYGSMRGWPTYVAAVQGLGSASTATKTISSAATTALAAASAQSTASSSQPKPVV